MNVSADYFRFLAFREKVLTDYAISHKECLLLRWITENATQEKFVKVTDVLGCKHIGSPATIHSLIGQLIDKKLVAVRQDKTDQRIKFLHPTSRTQKIYQLLTDEFAQRRQAICR